MKIIAYNHTHWDREWYKTFQDFRIRFAEVMEILVEEINFGNIDVFYLDGQTVVLEDYFGLYPEKKEVVQKLVEEKKIILGPWYALADEFLVSGEALYRNLFLGIKQSKDLGCNDFIGYLPDSFGHNSEIPRILSDFGIKNAVLWRGAGDFSSEFRWQSADNSQVLATYLIEGYFQNFIHDKISPKKKAENLKKFLDKIKEFSTSDCILLPIGGDHLAPVKNLSAELDKISQYLEDYTFEKASIFDYIEKINDLKLETLAVFKGELRNNLRNPILAGTLSTRNYLKKENSIAQWNLTKKAEPFSLFVNAATGGRFLPLETEFAYKMLLKNHAHDSICGCSIDEVHREMLPRFSQVNQISQAMILRASLKISEMVKNNSVWVYNLSDKEFSGLVNVKTDKPLLKELQKIFVKKTREFPEEILLDTSRPPFSEDMRDFREYLVFAEKIPPNSIKIINGEEKKSENIDIVDVSENYIKNSNISLDISLDGKIKLKDLKNNKTFENLHYFYDRADIGDTYNYSPLENDVPLVAKFLKSKIIEKNPLKSTLRLVYEINIPEKYDDKSKKRSFKAYKTIITSDITLEKASNQAKINTFWENKSEDHILQIKFKFNEKIKKTFAENSFGLIERTVDFGEKQTLPVKKGEEAGVITAPMQRFVWANGLGIITEGLHEYGVDDDELFVTVLRSVNMLSKLSLNTRNFPAGPPLQVPEAQCKGINSVRYSLCPAENPQDLFEQADIFFGSAIAGVGKSKNSSISICNSNFNFYNTDNKNIYTYATKLSEDRQGIILRMMNLSSENQFVKLSSDLDFCLYIEVNGLEEPVNSQQKFSQGIDFKPLELKNIYLKFRTV